MKLSNEEIVVVVVPVTNVATEVTCSEPMLALSFSDVVMVSDEKSGKVSTRVNGWNFFRWISI